MFISVCQCYLIDLKTRPVLVNSYIRQASGMKPKKKVSAPVKKAGKKCGLGRPIMLIDKTIVTTKQKTHTTIEDHVQIGELKATARTNQIVTPRNECLKKLEENDMSPFSNNGSSISPKCRKHVSPRPRDEKGQRKPAGKCAGLPEKAGERKKVETARRETKGKQRMTKEQFNQTTYQNLLLRKMDQKKITEMSQESSASIPKISKLQLNIVSTRQNRPTTMKNNVKDLKTLVFDKYRKEFPGLKKAELKFLCSIVYIQRLWRQRRIKNIISEFFSPRVTIEQNISLDSHRETNNSKLDLTTTTQEQTSELIRKYHHLSISSEKKPPFNKSNTYAQPDKEPEFPLNLKDLELSSQLTPQKQAKMIKLVECLRDISFFKPTKNEKPSKINVFSLQESLSEKCLMQQFYGRLFKEGSAKKNNFDIFSSKKEEKSLERSIELINTMKSPEKIETIEIEERFETELHSTEQDYCCEKEKVTVSVSVETEEMLTEDRDNSEIKTLKQLSLVSQGIIFMLLSEFSQEFHSFKAKSILSKKKKRMPGLKVNQRTIREYLSGLTHYMVSEYESEVIRRFCMVKPLCLLKIHHEYDDDDEYEDDADDEDYNMPIVPNSVFYQYQLIYEDTIFKIADQDKKFSNFLQGLIKVHNLLLANCLSQTLDKTRSDRLIPPWEYKFEPQRGVNRQKYARRNIQADLTQMINQICRSSVMRLGKFHQRLDNAQEELKMLSSINEQYKNEGSDWNGQYEHLQTRLELTKGIEEILLEEIIKDLMLFF